MLATGSVVCLFVCLFHMNTIIAKKFSKYFYEDANHTRVLGCWPTLYIILLIFIVIRQVAPPLLALAEACALFSASNSTLYWIDLYN